MINNSVKKCVICNNEKCGEFITINDKKYHLCCIEQQQTNWNELKKWLDNICFYDNDTITYEQISDKIQELEEKK